MVIDPDPAALTDWAVGFQLNYTSPPLPRIGINYGETLYRDSDYYGREVNRAARVVAHAGEGDVVVTQSIVDACGPNLEFDRIGEARLNGFAEDTDLFNARQAAD